MHNEQSAFDFPVLQAIAREFLPEIAFRSITPYGSGHINDTFLAEPYIEGRRYILQRMSQRAFKRPREMMLNIITVTTHLKAQVSAHGGDPEREVLNFLPTHTGVHFYIDEDGAYWRMCGFVENTITLQRADTPELFRQSARAFGQFAFMLRDFPVHTLHDTIPGFHDTPARYAQLDAAIEKDPLERAAHVHAELAFVQSLRTEAASLRNSLISGALPLRVTHNDTKINNVLLDETTGQGVCVIDLDTIMPGLIAYDFGDAIRYGANTAAEDETDLSLCSFSLPLFQAYAEGYLEQMHADITCAEVESLALGAKLMTLECGVRFLTDYLLGDVYFKISREQHNLDRARTQFQLVRDMQQKWDDMQRAVLHISARYGIEYSGALCIEKNLQ